MKGGDVATCTTFHMGKGSVYQCKDRSGRQLIEKEKNLGFWVLVTCNRRRKMQKRKGKENEDEEEICAFHLIVRGFFDLVCFVGMELGLGVRGKSINKIETSSFGEYSNYNLK